MLTPELLRALATLESKEGRFPPGFCLFKEGDHIDAVWVLKNGTVSLHTSRFSKDNPLHHLAHQKRLWGIRELILGLPFQFTGVAETEISGYIIPQTVIHRAMRENPMLRLMLMQAMAQELSHLPQSVVE